MNDEKTPDEVLKFAAALVENFDKKDVAPVFDPDKKLIFVDFETSLKGDFYVVGFKIDEHFEQIILNPDLAGLAAHHGLRMMSPTDACQYLLSICKSDDRTIVAYGNLERDLICDLLGLDRENSGFRYLNLHRSAKKWKSKFYQDAFTALPPLRKNAHKFLKKSQKNSLASLSRLCGLEPPSDYGPGLTSIRFKAAITSLSKKQQNYERLGRSTKAKATKALKHNKYDVLAMEPMVHAISNSQLSLLGYGIAY